MMLELNVCTYGSFRTELTIDAAFGCYLRPLKGFIFPTELMLG